MTNKTIASVLKETAALIELTGGNPFRSRAMANAARTIERLEESVSELLEAGTLTDIKGIGGGLAEQIGQVLKTGSFDVREEILSAIPPGLLDMLAVKGLGAKKVRALWKSMGIQTLDELETAAASGLIATQEGFGAKSESSILENVAALRAYRTKRHYAEAVSRAEALIVELLTIEGVQAIEMTGDLRRRMETISAIELVVGCEDSNARTAFNVVFPGATWTEKDGVRLLRTQMSDGFPLLVYVASLETFGSTLFDLTGSAQFLEAWTDRYSEVQPASTEAEVFAAAGLPIIPPELRESSMSIDLALDRSLPDLIVDEDLKGTLHNHSKYSDGAHSLQEMASAAREMGLGYFGICDHSQSLRIANGLLADDVAKQQSEIADLNRSYAEDGGPEFRIFSGIESDILSDGSLDYSDDILASFDFVVASVHVGFNMTEQEATERVVRAVSNPYTSILGHPTGRLLLRREGYPLDHAAVLDACAEHGVAVELNANPYRLDLDWRWIQAATERGILISINPDAHAIDQLAYTKWGVSVARKGFLTRQQCLNALPLGAFTEWIVSRKARRPA